MAGDTELARFFALQNTYAELYAAHTARGVIRTLDPNDKEFNDVGAWYIPHYFGVGADALRLVVQALAGNGRPPPRTILDFPCGSGRVTRHLTAFFSAARVVACDLYEPHVAFCRDTLGAAGMLSRENLEELDFGERFDLIFCGSLLTHLPEHLLRAGLRLLSRSLSDTGLVVATLHGRHTPFIQRNKWQYVSDELFAVAEHTVAKTGFGYVAYDHQFGTLFHKQSDYGVALTWPRWIMEALEPDRTVRVLGYAERAWDSHQDALVFGRPGIDD